MKFIKGVLDDLDKQDQSELQQVTKLQLRITKSGYQKTSL